ncbi:MAG: hypothetical protein NTU54_01760 [Candidatus Omnitrophica bacterium]|nr:hypothetical protein [Candidatus Omnitrophota bacterium]
MAYRISHIAYRKATFALTGFLLFLLNLCGCAPAARVGNGIVEAGKGFAGLSTKVLEDRRPDALAKAFHYNYSTSYEKAKKILNKIGCYIYTANFKKRLIAVYVSESDTTPVGIFFKDVDSENTEIQISSPSATAKEYIARRLFAIMAGLPDPEKKEEEKKGEEKKGNDASPFKTAS